MLRQALAWAVVNPRSTLRSLRNGNGTVSAPTDHYLFRRIAVPERFGRYSRHGSECFTTSGRLSSRRFVDHGAGARCGAMAERLTISIVALRPNNSDLAPAQPASLIASLGFDPAIAIRG